MIDYNFVFGFLGLIIAVILLIFYFIDRKRSWDRYFCRGLPRRYLYHSGTGGLQKKPFVADITTTKVVYQSLKKWWLNPHKPILIQGNSGIGKTRAVEYFLSTLSIRERLITRILVPTLQDIRDRNTPLFPFRYILYLNDIQNFKDKDMDIILQDIFINKKFKHIIGTSIPQLVNEWTLAKNEYWTIINVPQITLEDGEKIAHAYGLKFENSTSINNIVDIIMPDAEFESDIAARSEVEREALVNLKIFQHLLRSPADYDMLSSMSDGSFTKQMFLRLKLSDWCLERKGAISLRDGIDRHIYYSVDFTKDSDKLLHRLKKCKTRLASDALTYLGIKYIQKQQFEKALEAYKSAFNIDKLNDMALSNWGTSIIQQALSTSDSSKKQILIDEAISKFNQANEINPNNWLVWYNRGGAFLEKSNFEYDITKKNQLLEFAESDLEKFVTKYPMESDGWYLYAEILFHRSTFCISNERITILNQALSKYNKFIELAPDDPRGYVGRGAVYGNFMENVQNNMLDSYRDRAIESFQQALKIRPNDIHALRSLVTLYINYSTLKSECSEQYLLKAYNLISEVIIAYPKKHYLYHMLGDIQMKLGIVGIEPNKVNIKYVEQAINSFQMAITIKGDDDISWADLGMAISIYTYNAPNTKIARECYNRSIEAIQKAISINPNNPKHRIKLANIKSDFKNMMAP